MKLNAIIAPLLGPVIYPVAMLAAFLYLWCAGEISRALFASILGAAGTAWGWATK
jgi:hypothetical protein